MKSFGIIAEFNPFHLGHKYLIDKAREETGSEICVAVMSGSFVQRGGPAVYDKWERARMALEGGVNLVLELPAVYATASAESFALGGVKTLEALGCVDTLVFGSESGHIGQLESAARLLQDREEELMEVVSSLCKTGLSFPRAREEAVRSLAPDFNVDIFRESNNILAIEYLKQVDNMKVHTIKRIGQGHHESATALRKRLAEEDLEGFKRAGENYFNLIRTRILQCSSESLEAMCAAGEGLGNRLKDCVRFAGSTEELIGNVKSKAYTYSAVERLLSHIVLGIEPDYKRMPGYARVLGFDEKGAALLKRMKKAECNRIPVITNINKEWECLGEYEDMMDKDILATDVFNVIWGKNMYRESDYVKKPVIMKKDGDE